MSADCLGLFALDTSLVPVTERSCIAKNWVIDNKDRKHLLYKEWLNSRILQHKKKR